MSQLKNIPFVLIAAAFAVALSGCTAQAPSGAGASGVSGVTQAQLKDLVNIPPEIEVARQYVDATCLRRGGVNMPIDLSVPTKPDGDDLVGVLGLFTSVDIARTNGYSTSVKTGNSPAESFVGSMSKSVSAQYQALELGDQNKTVSYKLPSGASATTQADGCFAKSADAVYGSPVKYLQLTTVRDDLAPEVSLRNATGLTSRMSTYSSCMKQAGVNTQNLQTTVKIAQARFGQSRPEGSHPSANESSLAVTDATCQQKAGLPQYYNGQFYRQAGSWIKRNQGWITATDELRSAALAKAKRILQSAGAGS